VKTEPSSKLSIQSQPMAKDLKYLNYLFILDYKTEIKESNNGGD
jgi:hypothetical protein